MRRATLWEPASSPELRVGCLCSHSDQTQGRGPSRRLQLHQAPKIHLCSPLLSTLALQQPEPALSSQRLPPSPNNTLPNETNGLPPLPRHCTDPPPRPAAASQVLLATAQPYTSFTNRPPKTSHNPLLRGAPTSTWRCLLRKTPPSLPRRRRLMPLSAPSRPLPALARAPPTRPMSLRTRRSRAPTSRSSRSACHVSQCNNFFVAFEKLICASHRNIRNISKKIVRARLPSTRNTSRVNFRLTLLPRRLMPPRPMPS